VSQAPGIEIQNPKGYQSKLLTLLGDRNPLHVLAETPEALASRVKPHSAEVLRRRPFPGKWTPNEILGHLADTEWVFGYRIRLILCEEQPTLLGMDQEKWVTGQQRNERDPADQLEEFRVLRRYNLALWKSMTPSNFERIGRHNERGPEPLGLMLRMEAGHDLSHLNQLDRYLAAIIGQK